MSKLDDLSITIRSVMSPEHKMVWRSLLSAPMPGRDPRQPWDGTASTAELMQELDQRMTWLKARAKRQRVEYGLHFDLYTDFAPDVFWNAQSFAEALRGLVDNLSEGLDTSYNRARLSYCMPLWIPDSLCFWLVYNLPEWIVNRLAKLLLA